MIFLEKLNGESFYLNYFQIVSIEQIPETKIKLQNGDFYLVKNSVDSILLQAQNFLRSSLNPDGKYHSREDLAAYRDNDGRTGSPEKSEQEARH